MPRTTLLGGDHRRTEKRLVERTAEVVPFYGTPTHSRFLRQCSVACHGRGRIAFLPAWHTTGARERLGGSRQARDRRERGATKVLSGLRELKEATLRCSPAHEGRSANFPQLPMNIKVYEYGFYDVDDGLDECTQSLHTREKEGLDSLN